VETSPSLDDQATAARGAHAGMAKAELQRRVTERVESILNNAINKHRGKDGLSGDEAKAVIATVSEMRLLLGGVETDIRQGEQARQRMMAPTGTTPSAER